MSESNALAEMLWLRRLDVIVSVCNLSDSRCSRITKCEQYTAGVLAVLAASCTYVQLALRSSTEQEQEMMYDNAGG